MSLGTRALVLAITVAALAACSGDRDDARLAVLEQARQDVIAASELQPQLAADETVQLGSVESKDAPTYLVATGRLLLAPEEAARHISGAIAQVGFTKVTPNQPRPGAVAGVRDNVVVEVVVSEELGLNRAGVGQVQAEPGESFVQLQIGTPDPRLAWTQVN